MPAAAAIPDIPQWCARFVRSTSLRVKRQPGPPPSAWGEETPQICVDRPGRPPELELCDTTPRSMRRRELRKAGARARLLHTFWHHELQAAELMAWAILRFPETPKDFRHGLLQIALDEIRHMQIYERCLQRRGYPIGSFPVRDWFWERARSCATPLQFVSLLNLGLEGGNLDHCQRFAEAFRAVGDEEAAGVQELIEREEIAHVRFGLRWFETWTGGQDFARFAAELVAPLSPQMMRGAQLNLPSRRAAGFDEAFLSAFAAASRSR